MNELETRVDKLEQRVMTLEKLAQIGELLRSETLERREKELVEQYGEHVDKSTAARIMGVTRATVYAMLADRRIDGAFGGKRVDVRSIARYINAGYTNNRRRKHAADALEEA